MNKEKITLRDLIAIHNLQHYEFAAKLGFTNVSVSHWVNGKVPSARNRNKISELYPDYDILWGSKI
jgi:transcriptional regulator with XRE-family HTH domain